MKWKYIFLFFTIISSLFLGLMSVDDFKLFVNNGIKDNIFFKSLIVILIVGSTLLNVYITYIEPQKKLEKAIEVINNQLLHTATQLINRWDKDGKGYEIKFNVMEIGTYRKGYLFLDPDDNGKGAFKLFPKIFKCIWTAPKSHMMPKDFFLGIRQGSNGKALSINAYDAENVGKKVDIGSSRIIPKDEILELAMYSLVDGQMINGMMVIKSKDYEYFRLKLNLNRKQYEEVRKTKLLFSLPIHIRKASDKVPKLVSVLTLESPDANLAYLMSIDTESLDETDAEQKVLKGNIMNMKNELMETIGEIRDTYVRLYF